MNKSGRMIGKNGDREWWVSDGKVYSFLNAELVETWDYFEFCELLRSNSVEHFLSHEFHLP